MVPFRIQLAAPFRNRSALLQQLPGVPCDGKDKGPFGFRFLVIFCRICILQSPCVWGWLEGIQSVIERLQSVISSDTLYYLPPAPDLPLVWPTHTLVPTFFTRQSMVYFDALQGLDIRCHITVSNKFTSKRSSNFVVFSSKAKYTFTAWLVNLHGTLNHLKLRT